MAEKIFVSGGGGFLGQALIKRLLNLGYTVQTLNRRRYPELEALGVVCYQGDLADFEAVRRAAQGCQIAFHVGAKAGIWGDYDDYYKANVVGTQNVLQVCHELGIDRLIYTSSPSISFAGVDQEGVDENDELPNHYVAHYPETKAQAEKLVLEATGEKLATVALRPHLIWGPGDNQIIPRLIQRAKSGRLRLIGKAGKKVDAIYIDNAVEAHICALRELKKGAVIDGKAYFVTNEEPMPLEDIINSILKAAKLPPVTRRIPARLALIIGAILETVYSFFGIKREPVLTRFAALQLSTAHWYNTKAAREELHYVPLVSMQEGFARLQKALEKELGKNQREL